jgi:hypothetical protein
MNTISVGWRAYKRFRGKIANVAGRGEVRIALTA